MDGGPGRAGIGVKVGPTVGVKVGVGVGLGSGVGIEGVSSRRSIAKDSLSLPSASQGSEEGSRLTGIGRGVKEGTEKEIGTEEEEGGTNENERGDGEQKIGREERGEETT